MVRKNDVAERAAVFAKEKAKEIREYNFNDFEDEDLKRQFKKLSALDYYALSEEKYKELLNVVDGMQSNYAKVKVCDYVDKTKCNLSLEPEITEKFQKSRDPEELKYYWTKWYDAAGTPAKDNFLRYVELANEAAKLNSKIFNFIHSFTPIKTILNILFLLKISHHKLNPGWTSTRTTHLKNNLMKFLQNSNHYIFKYTHMFAIVYVNITDLMLLHSINPYPCICSVMFGDKRGRKLSI